MDTRDFGRISFLTPSLQISETPPRDLPLPRATGSPQSGADRALVRFNLEMASRSRPCGEPPEFGLRLSRGLRSAAVHIDLHDNIETVLSTVYTALVLEIVEPVACQAGVEHAMMVDRMEVTRR
jgi:hypothetical protein